MQRLDSRVAKLEADSGLNGNPIDRLSDAELDELLVRVYGTLSAKYGRASPTELDVYCLADLEPEPILEVSRKFWPMTTDIRALGLKRAGRTFYDECADLTIEQIEARVNTHIERISDDAKH